MSLFHEKAVSTLILRQNSANVTVWQADYDRGYLYECEFLDENEKAKLPHDQLYQPSRVIAIHNTGDRPVNCIHFGLVSLCFCLQYAFSGLTLLVGRHERYPACKNWVMRCWCGYRSGMRCKWSAYDPADATATPSFLASLKSRMVYLSGASLPRLSWKEGH